MAVAASWKSQCWLLPFLALASIVGKWLIRYKFHSRAHGIQHVGFPFAFVFSLDFLALFSLYSHHL